MENDIFSYLKHGYTFKEIQDMLQLSDLELADFLKKVNENIRSHYMDQNFYSDGTKSKTDNLNESFRIITEPLENDFRFLVISDTHIGSMNDNFRYLDIVYNYCIKNNINYIIHGGDLVDGLEGLFPKRIEDICQVLEVVDKYPTDPSITNFITLGNHDFDLIASHYPVHEALMDLRSDLIPMGYGTNEMFVKNDSMIIDHFVPIDKTDKSFSRKLILRGHSHRMKLKDDHNNYRVYIPSLSDIKFEENFVPSFLDVIINFKNGYFNNIYIKDLGIIDNRLFELCSNNLYMGYKLPHTDKGLNVKEYKKKR